MKSSILAFEDISFGIYIYISTDSVYEVTEAKYIVDELQSDSSYETNDSLSSYSSDSSSSSDSSNLGIERRNSEDLRKNLNYFTKDGLVLENYAFHTKRSQRFRDYLLKRDAYGFEKLTAENIINKHWNNSGNKRNYINLRLPDVIGAYDDSGRFWVIILRMMIYQRFDELGISEARDCFKFEFDFKKEDKNLPTCDSLSLVSWYDVVNSITAIYSRYWEDLDSMESILNSSYNLVSSEWPIDIYTMHQIIFEFLNNFHHWNLKFDDIWIKGGEGDFTYPSVHWGPISSEKADTVLKDLGYQPINIKQSLETAAEFFTTNTKIGKFDNERLQLLSPYPKHFGKLLIYHKI